MYKLKKMFFSIIILFIVSCGSEKGASTENPSNNFTATQPSNNTSINDISKPNVSTEKGVLEAIQSIPNIRKVNAPWLVNHEWVTYDAVDKISNEKYTFSQDGSYTYEVIYSSTTVQSSGNWVIYKKEGSERLMLFLTSNNKLTVFAIEQEGENAFRLIFQFNNTLQRSKLYTRLDSDEEVLYTGMFFLGKFTYTDYASSLYDYTSIYTYIFKKDFTVVQTIEKTSIANGSEPSSRSIGTWSVNSNDTTLTLSFDNEVISYSVGKSSENNILLTANGKEEFWQKVYEPFLKDIDNLIGEYQSPKEDNYLTIKKESTKYFVDLVLNHSSSNKLYHIEAKEIEKNVISFIVPEEEKEIIIRSAHNRLVFLAYPLYGISDYEKVSKYPLSTQPALLGEWRSTVFRANNYMTGQYFLDNGLYLYYDNQGLLYGKYTQTDTSLTSKKECKDPRTVSLTRTAKYLTINTINHMANLGLRDWGKEGAKVAEIYAKNSFDIYQKENTPKLISHPQYKGAYLFKKKTSFSDGYASVFHFNSDGTGSIVSVFGGSYVDSYSGTWLDNYQSGLVLGLKYFIFLERGKEYISYYYDGAFVSYNDKHYSGTQGWTIGQIQEDIKDVKIVELFHRRTALCRQDDATIYDGTKGGTIMLLEK